MILHADSMAVIISLTGRAVGEMAKFKPLCRIDSSCWFKVRSDLLITHLSLMALVSCSSTSTIGMRVRSVGGACDSISLANLCCCLARHFSHSALCACVTQLVTSVCMSLGNDVNNSSFMSAIKPLNVLILKFISFILTFKSALCVLCMMLLAASPLTQVLTRRLTGVMLRCLQCSVKCRWFRNLALSLSSFSHSRTCISVIRLFHDEHTTGVKPSQIRITLMTMFKVTTSPPNEVR